MKVGVGPIRVGVGLDRVGADHYGWCRAPITVGIEPIRVGAGPSRLLPGPLRALPNHRVDAELSWGVPDLSLGLVPTPLSLVREPPEVVPDMFMCCRTLFSPLSWHWGPLGLARNPLRRQFCNYRIAFG